MLADRLQLVEMGIPRASGQRLGEPFRMCWLPQGAPSKYPILLGPLPHGDSDPGEMPTVAAGDSEYPDCPWGCLLSSQRWALTAAPKSRTSVEGGRWGTIGE